MRAADTNLLVRLIAQDDAKQAAAAKSFVSAGAWVSHLVLAETIWVLDSVYELGPAALATAVRMLLEHDALVLQDPDVVEAALDSFTARPNLGFSDCLILEIARKAGHLPLGTFDRGLAKLDGAQKV
ncbi:MAG: PIN domain-containing protein [Myxococcales bacterium]|jgi:predicted nucleic-acid-binding protein|nr:PIN domain-containing protein [Myxococcales bacterium]